MKELLVAEIKRALELFEKIEKGEEEYKILKAENDRKSEEKKENGSPYYYYYTPDPTFKYEAELKKLLKMIRLHSVIYEKELKR